jgi:hypothetical protein
MTMKAKVLKIFAEIDIDILLYCMKQYGYRTIGQLADKYSCLYNADDVERIREDIEYAYNSDNKR